MTNHNFCFKMKVTQVISVQLCICLLGRPELLQENVRLDTDAHDFG